MKNNRRRLRAFTSGFTRPELLAVVAALALLVPLVTAATRPTEAKTLVCLANLRMLEYGMTLYAEDYRGLLPGNSDSGNPGQNWVAGGAQTGSSDFGNVNLLRDPSKSRLTPYLRGVPAVYRCPADSYTQRIAGRSALQARSYSLNAAVGTNPLKGGTVAVDGPWLDGGYGHTVGKTWRTYGRFADMVAPPPARLFTFLDEHPYSINDGTFSVSARTSQWIDWPANHHDAGGAFAFADGHAEHHRWTDRRTLITPLQLNVPANGNLDLVWIQQRTTALIAK